MAITVVNDTITKGPANHGFVDALKYAFDSDNPHLVELTINGIGKIKVQIMLIAHEDGSGKKFLFTGYVRSAFNESNLLYCCSDREKKIHGYYDSRAQQGWAGPGWDAKSLGL